MGDVDVGRGGPTVDRHDASLDLCPCPRASSMARGHVQEDELDRGNGVPRGMQRRCERAWPRSWCSAETIPFSIATAEAGFCELDGQRSSPRKGAHRLLGLLAMIKSRASTHSCFPVFGFLAMIKSRASTHSCSRLAGLGHRRRLAELGPDGCRELSSASGPPRQATAAQRRAADAHVLHARHRRSAGAPQRCRQWHKIAT